MIELIIHTGNLILISAIATAAQQLLLFRSGILVLSIAGFSALGAYTAAWVSTQFSIHIIIAIFLGSFISALISIVVGFPLFFRLTDDYLALATLMLSLLIESMLGTFGMGGSSGLAGIGEIPAILISGSTRSIRMFIPLCLLTFFAFILVRILWKSRLALFADAARMDSNYLSSRGHNPRMISLQFFIIGSFLAGLAGAIQAHYIGVIEPSMASLSTTVTILCGGIIAGRKSYLGPLFGASVVIIIPQLLQQLPFWSGETYWMLFPIVKIIFALLLIAIAFAIFADKQLLKRND